MFPDFFWRGDLLSTPMGATQYMFPLISKWGHGPMGPLFPRP